MRKLTKTVFTMRAGAGVKRCHTFHTTRPYSVGQHTNGMLQLLYATGAHALVRIDEVVARILIHDLPEALTGDIPAPMARALKSSYPNEIDCAEEDFIRRIGFPLPSIYHKLTDKESLIIRTLDSLEFYIFAYEEYFHYGNKAVGPMLLRGREFLLERWDRLTTVIKTTENTDDGHPEFLANMDMLLNDLTFNVAIVQDDVEKRGVYAPYR